MSYSRWAKVIGGKWNPIKVYSGLFLCLSVYLNLQKQLSSKCIFWTDPVISGLAVSIVQIEVDFSSKEVKYRLTNGSIGDVI